MNNNSENDTLYQKFKNFFKNIDCFFKCVFNDSEMLFNNFEMFGL